MTFSHRHEIHNSLCFFYYREMCTRICKNIAKKGSHQRNASMVVLHSYRYSIVFHQTESLARENVFGHSFTHFSRCVLDVEGVTLLESCAPYFCC